jgi:hypothetical protein
MSSAVALDVGRPGSIWRIYLRAKLKHLLGGNWFAKKSIIPSHVRSMLLT